MSSCEEVSLQCTICLPSVQTHLSKSSLSGHSALLVASHCQKLEEYLPIHLTLLPADQVVSWLVVTACTVAVSAVDSEPEPQGPRGSLVLFPGPPRPHESVQ